MDDHKSVGIKDIAKLAGVSTGTVDRVLHNRGKVSAVASKKVLDALEQIDYKPNFLARNLGANKVHRIAALIPNAQFDEYWYQCQKGINHAAANWDHFNIKLEPFHFDLADKATFHAAAQQTLRAQPHGVLIAPLFYDEALPYFRELEKQRVPYVLFNTDIKGANPLGFIGQNYFQSGRLAAELLHLHASPDERGAFAIVHIEEDVHNSAHLIEKENGFREYFKEIVNSKTEVISLSLGHPHDTHFKNQLDQLFAHEWLKGIFVSTSKAFELALYMDTRKARKIRVVGYDLLSKNLFYLKRGAIDFLIHQNPERQAFQGIGSLANYLIFSKKVKPRNLFPLEIITRENLSSYLNSDTW